MYTPNHISFVGQFVGLAEYNLAKPLKNKGFLRIDGGEGGIRTHGTFTRTPVFKTGSLNRSDTSPTIKKA